MKNNSCLRRSDEAVTPVIAVILMVAITVVLSATAYVWMSGFAQHTLPAPRTIALSSDAPAYQGAKSFTVATSSGGFRWGDVVARVDETTLTLHPTPSCPAATASTFVVCNNGASKTPTDVVAAGDTLKVPATSGQTLRIVDVQANAVLLTTIIG